LRVASYFISFDKLIMIVLILSLLMYLIF